MPSAPMPIPQPTHGPSPVPRPAVHPAQPWTFPIPTDHVLVNGLTVLGYDTPGQHVLSLRLSIPASLAREPREQEGVGALMARTVDEGTRSHTPQHMAELLERKGMALSAGVGERGLSIEVDVPARRLTEAVTLLREVLVEADFPEAEVRRHQRARLAEIDEELAVPAQRAHREFNRTFYAATDRLSRAVAGESDTVAGLTRQAVLEHHHDVIRPAGATLAVAGHLQGIDLPALLEPTLGTWVGPAAPSTQATCGQRAADAARVVIVDRPDSVQSELYVGCLGPDRRVDGGWAPFPVLGFILGGGPQARIDAVLREEKGYTYGMRSMFRPRASDGLFVTSGAVRTDVTAESLALLLRILDQARDGFTQEETRAGVEYVSKTAPARYGTADAVADEAASRALDGTTTAETTRTLQDMLTLTPDRLTEAYRRFIDGSWTVIVVGDAERCEPELRNVVDGPISVVPA